MNVCDIAVFCKLGGISLQEYLAYEQALHAWHRSVACRWPYSPVYDNHMIDSYSFAYMVMRQNTEVTPGNLQEPAIFSNFFLYLQPSGTAKTTKQVDRWFRIHNIWAQTDIRRESVTKMCSMFQLPHVPSSRIPMFENHIPNCQNCWRDAHCMKVKVNEYTICTVKPVLTTTCI